MTEILNVEDMISPTFEHKSTPGRWILSIDGCDAFVLSHKHGHGGFNKDSLLDIIDNNRKFPKELEFCFYKGSSISSKQFEKFCTEFLYSVVLEKKMRYLISLKFLNQLGNIVHLLGLIEPSNGGWDFDRKKEMHTIKIINNGALILIRNGEYVF